MTTTLIENLRQIHAQSNDEGDREFLGVILKCDEAAKAAEELADELLECKECGEKWPASLMDDESRCPDCLIDILNERRRRWREGGLIEGW